MRPQEFVYTHQNAIRIDIAYQDCTGHVMGRCAHEVVWSSGCGCWLEVVQHSFRSIKKRFGREANDNKYCIRVSSHPQLCLAAAARMESEGEQSDTGLGKFFFVYELAVHTRSCRRHLG